MLDGPRRTVEYIESVVLDSEGNRLGLTGGAPPAFQRPEPGNVLVSGGSGFVAGYLIRQLVGEGWTVRTTIRDSTREHALRESLEIDDARLGVIAADLSADEGWHEAAAGCTHIAHLASPIPAGAVKHADSVIAPARDGTLRILRAARAAGARRVVMTSSVAAITYGHPRERRVFTEADWTDVAHRDAHAYVRSKTIAERAAREWVAVEGRGMEFCTINPALVLGPVRGPDYSPSVEVVRKLLDGSIAACPDVGWAIVDVRDVADLHVRALRASRVAGERFVAAGPFMKMLDIARILRERLGDEARRVTARKLPNFAVRLAALVDPLARQAVGQLGRIREMRSSRATDVLGWTPRPPEQTIVDTARSLLDLHLVGGPRRG